MRNEMRLCLLKAHHVAKEPGVAKTMSSVGGPE